MLIIHSVGILGYSHFCLQLKQKRHISVQFYHRMDWSNKVHAQQAR